jgi:hypothetical protein
MGQVSLFLGTEFTFSLSQQYFAETLLKSSGIESTHISTVLTPYHLGHAIDLIPHESMLTAACDEI